MARILYIQYTNPGGYPPLQHSSRILGDAGWKVLFLGTGALGSNALEFPAHQNVTVRRMRFCPAGWRQKLHYVGYCFWVLWMTMVWRPRWVYASDPLSCPIATILSWLPGVKLLYHEHDSPELTGTGSRFLKLVSRSRLAVAQRAEACILPNAKRLERFQAECGLVRRGVRVWNCPGLYEVATQPKEPASDHIWLLYHGSIVPARLTPAVVDALCQLPDSVRLRVVGYETTGHHGYVANLMSRARSLGIEHRIEFRTAVPRTELFASVKSSDIGLALVPMESNDSNFAAMTGASNKAFDYLACGLPLLVSDLPDWRQMFVDPGYALACNPNDPQSIAAAIRWLVDHPDQMRAMGENGRQRILTEWNYENVFRPVLQRILEISKTRDEYLQTPAVTVKSEEVELISSKS